MKVALMLLLSQGGDVGKLVKGAVKDSFRISHARSWSPSIRDVLPPKMSAGRGGRQLALAPSSLEDGV